VPVTPKHRDEVVVRRIKEDIRAVQGGFPERKVVQIDIDGLPANAPELKLMSLLNDYRALREERLKDQSKRKQATSGLLIINLQQRLLSSIEAFASTLRVHRRTAKRQWEEASGSAPSRPSAQADLALLYGPVEADDDRAELSEEELQSEQESLIEAASAESNETSIDEASRSLFEQELKLLEQMAEIADSAVGHPDARIKKLIEWIREQMCPELGKPGAKWNDTRVIIFTEWDDTKRYLKRQLDAAIEGSDRYESRIEIYHGPTPPAKREEIKRAFNADPTKHPVRILIATDAAREGLNLQAHCYNLFHFDVPWNPSRMEQRNGRIDRKLQPSPNVFCHYFVYRQRPEDRVLQVLVRKTETIREELGSLSQVIDARLAKSMKRGIKRGDIEALTAEIEAADLDAEHRRAIEEELEAARERQTALREQIDRLRNIVDNSRKSIGLDEQHFRSAISCALELVGSEPLSPEASSEGDGPKHYAFPALDQRKGGDPTWADTLDTLREPRKREQKWWEWRKDSPIRPVVFDDPGIVTDEVVHLHLEHRVVQRLLGRFTAQGFVLHDISRACFAQATDAIPRVILLGRLCLYGPNAARLHEELIPVTARWTDPAIRKEALAPYAREAETKTLSLLDESLLASRRDAITGEVTAQLQAAAPGDVQQLLPHLEARGAEYAADAMKKLTQRGDAEAKAMREILETQQKHIEKTIAKYEKTDPRQLRFDFEEEIRQLEADKRYWANRLAMLDDELKSEPSRIRELYDVKATRVEPVGLVYLWPITG